MTQWSHFWVFILEKWKLISKKKKTNINLPTIVHSNLIDEVQISGYLQIRMVGDKEVVEGTLCGDQLVLYLGCRSGYTNTHMG